MENKLNEKELIALRLIIEKHRKDKLALTIQDHALNLIWSNIPRDKECKVSDAISIPIRKFLTDISIEEDFRNMGEKDIYDLFESSFARLKEEKMTGTLRESSEYGEVKKPNATIKEDYRADKIIDVASPPIIKKNQPQEIAVVIENNKDKNIKKTLFSKLVPSHIKDKKATLGKDDIFVRYNLENGKAGQNYSETLDMKKLFPAGNVVAYSIEGLNSIGLFLDNKAGKISGVPKEQGDPVHNYEHELVVRYQTNDGSKESKKIYLKILPDPKSLWKTLEPPMEMGDRKAHEYRKMIIIKGSNVAREKNIIAASKRGRSHAHNATFRDDHASIKYLEDIGWSILAVSDGAGSANLSRVASQVACEKAIESISSKLIKHNNELSDAIKATIAEDTRNSTDNSYNIVLKKILYEIIASAGFESAKAIHEECKRRNAQIKQFYTTYLTAIHREFEFGNFFAGFWVGDGALGVYSKSKEINLLGVPDEGEYSGQTKFIIENDVLTSESLMQRIYYTVTNDFTALFAMTDGVSDPKFKNDKNLQDVAYWDILWGELEKEVLYPRDNADVKLIEWLDFWEQGEHDDRTIAILY